jgi:hypothetical protein
MSYRLESIQVNPWNHHGKACGGTFQKLLLPALLHHPAPSCHRIVQSLLAHAWAHHARGLMGVCIQQFVKQSGDLLAACSWTIFPHVSVATNQRGESFQEAATNLESNPIPLPAIFIASEVLLISYFLALPSDLTTSCNNEPQPNS